MLTKDQSADHATSRVSNPVSAAGDTWVRWSEANNDLHGCVRKSRYLFEHIENIRLGALAFVSGHSELRACDRVFGNDLYPKSFMTVVRKHLCAGDRNGKAGKSEWFDQRCSEWNPLAISDVASGDRNEQGQVFGM